MVKRIEVNIVAGRILELLEHNKGLFAKQMVSEVLKEPEDLVLKGIECLVKNDLVEIQREENILIEKNN
ncbi:MAG: hypothetical protein P9X22_08040 [Candidatus Zapsychrus exili]|nr:hypothetical protein [Candidatus Zapsychrus exili]MDP8213218.1 hypothetical protein [Candidatus Zapsychrus exili]